MKSVRAGILAEFDASEPMAAAATRLRAEGFESIVTFTPYEIPGLAETLGMGRTLLPRITLIGGLTGAAFAYWLQWYTAAVSYPLNAGARPAHAPLAFLLITFETTVLFASCAGFFGVFFLLGMPQLWHPVSEIEGFERSTIDRFWVGVSRDDPRFDAERITRAIAAECPLRIVTLEAGA
jgi:hypothetical protein